MNGDSPHSNDGASLVSGSAFQIDLVIFGGKIHPAENHETIENR